MREATASIEDDGEGFPVGNTDPNQRGRNLPRQDREPESDKEVERRRVPRGQVGYLDVESSWKTSGESLYPPLVGEELHHKLIMPPMKSGGGYGMTFNGDYFQPKYELTTDYPGQSPTYHEIGPGDELGSHWVHKMYYEEPNGAHTFTGTHPDGENAAYATTWLTPRSRDPREKGYQYSHEEM